MDSSESKLDRHFNAPMKQSLLSFSSCNFLPQAQLRIVQRLFFRRKIDLIAAHFALVKSIAESLVGKTNAARSRLERAWK